LEKHKGYQDYLTKEKERGVKKIAKNFACKNDFLYKLYMRLTDIPIKKLSSVPNIKNADKILDVGCGTGNIIDYIGRFLNPKAKFYCLDLDKNPLLSEKIEFSKCDVDVEAFLFSDNEFDVVISSFVIEHLKNPQNLFSETFRTLKSGGYFYCVTDYYTSVFCPDGYNFYSDPTHVRPWTKKSLSTLAEMSGFEVYKVGVVRWWEYLTLLLPVFPVITLLTPHNFSFIPCEILGRTVYIIAKKP